MNQLSSNSAYNQTTRWVLTAIVIIIILAALWLIRGILLLMLASVILVVLFTMPVAFLMRRGLGRTTATLISLFGIVGLFILLMTLAGSTLVQQFTVLATDVIPKGVDQLINRLQEAQLPQQFPFLQPENIQSLINTLGGQIGSAVSSVGATVLPVLGGVADVLLSTLIVIFISLYLLADPEMHLDGLIKLFPLWYRRRAREIFARLDLTLRGWLRATIISMVFVGVATWGGLAVLGIRQAAALGVLAGLLSFVPNFGPIIALVPSVAVGLVQAQQNIGWIIVVIYGVSFIQSQVVGPLLVAESIKLPAVLVLLGQIVAGAFLGFLGIMLAVPLTAIVMVLVQEIYIKDVLGDVTAEKSPMAEAEAEEMMMPDGI
jgi:predicted PurR-regulated permease PerM